jgi:serine/threonine-protein kinase
MLDIFAEDRRVYIVLEQVQGTNLRRLVREEGPRPPAEAVQLGIKMCEILNYLHAQQPPVVHRDFTPDNIIIKPDGSLVLIDFSVASHRKQYAGDCVGKHAYTAPDQFRGQSCPQSDLYALGATIYYLLVGSDPVPLSVSHPLQKRADVPAALDSIVARATALKLADRYESAEWLRLDLAKLATGVESGSAGSVQAAVDKELTEGTVISLPDPV